MRFGWPTRCATGGFGCARKACSGRERGGREAVCAWRVFVFGECAAACDGRFPAYVVVPVVRGGARENGAKDGGFAEDAAVNEEEELDGALLDDDEGVALPDAAAPGKTCCIAPG